jgi:hypothetical protein
LLLFVSRPIDRRGRGSQSNRNAEKPPLVEKVLAGGCFVIFGAYALSESAVTLTILSVILQALVVLFKETLS